VSREGNRRNRRKQEEIKAKIKLMDDLPRGAGSFVGISTDPIEVDLAERSIRREVSAAAEGFQVEELIFDEEMDGFDTGLV